MKVPGDVLVTPRLDVFGLLSVPYGSAKLDLIFRQAKQPSDVSCKVKAVGPFDVIVYSYVFHLFLRTLGSAFYSAAKKTLGRVAYTAPGKLVPSRIHTLEELLHCIDFLGPWLQIIPLDVRSIF